MGISQVLTVVTFSPSLTLTRLQALLMESSFSLVLLQSQAQWSRSHCLGARGWKRFLFEVESKRLTKQYWFITQWICINHSCVLYQLCLFRIWTVLSLLSWNKWEKGTYKHLLLGHWYVLSDSPFLKYHYRSSLQGKFNNSQEQVQFSDKCCFSCNLIREHQSVVSSHQTHHMCWITRGQQ